MGNPVPVCISHRDTIGEGRIEGNVLLVSMYVRAGGTLVRRGVWGDDDFAVGEALYLCGYASRWAMCILPAKVGEGNHSV
ncbi:hypothetical protein FA13DRAFT_169392 [Coprinellus micaceus]|uniref:Uncharacterized protein n=1 Tax=Coprinellus micaceus TaxID=71717 RepID=A0A4Y7SH87_COPMI|nr:hypothetical protein FA13DRAFT_169392 [Coprinellus micaceus]